MKLKEIQVGGTYYDKRHGTGIISHIDTECYVVDYNGSIIEYKHRNIERILNISIWGGVCLFWVVIYLIFS